MLRFKKPDTDIVTGKRLKNNYFAGQSLSSDSENDYERGIKGHKDVSFNEIIEVKSLALDVFNGEHLQQDERPYHQKFMVRTLERDHIYYAKTEKERVVWLEGFAKILDYNK